MKCAAPQNPADGSKNPSNQTLVNEKTLHWDIQTAALCTFLYIGELQAFYYCVRIALQS